MKARYRVTKQQSCGNLRYLLVEGSGDLLRMAVSSHKTPEAAARAAAKWNAPAVVAVLDAKTWCELALELEPVKRGCRHPLRARRVEALPFFGAVSSEEIPQAHGGVCEVTTCGVCGATKRANVNGRFVEHGRWEIGGKQ